MVYVLEPNIQIQDIRCTASVSTLGFLGALEVGMGIRLGPFGSGLTSRRHIRGSSLLLVLLIFTILFPLKLMPANKRELRAYLRAQRTALSAQQQRQHAQALAQGFLQAPSLLKHRHIAFYLPQDGEIDPRPLMQALLKRRHCVYLPVLHPVSHHQLWFVRYHTKMPLIANRFGILEPQLTAYGYRASNRLPAWALGIIALPLVGFDSQGGRLGMGGGFYDRSLAFTRRAQGNKPLLLGLAHECQKLDDLPVEPWDIPLQGVLTEAHLYWHNGKGQLKSLALKIQRYL